MNPEIERCLPWIEAALEYAGGTHKPDHVVASILKGDLQLWPGERSAIVTEIDHYPLLDTCHLFLAGGEMGELQRMLPSVEAWAKQVGCSRVSLAGRKGWQRSFLRDDGYAPKWWVLAKEL